MRFVPEVLRVRAFRDVWLASMASNAGNWLQIVASGWLILEATGSPAAVGALALVTRAPAIALSALAGRLADRYDRRLVGIWTFLLQAAAAAALAVITFTAGVSVVAIYALTFLVGVGFALGLPAMLALIPSLVPRSQLSQAVSLNAAGINVARLLGPAIGGLTLAVFGATTCFALNALSFLALVAVLLRRCPRARPRRGRRGRGCARPSAWPCAIARCGASCSGWPCSPPWPRRCRSSPRSWPTASTRAPAAWACCWAPWAGARWSGPGCWSAWAQPACPATGRCRSPP